MSNGGARARGSVRIGIDTGGTFTDVVAVDSATGQVTTTKTPSTPDDPSRGFLDGLSRMLTMLDTSAGAVQAVSHGTTVATNALLADEFGGLGFLTTAGFRHVLEIARQSVPDGYGNSYFWVKPARIVPLHRVREVPERLDSGGERVTALDADAVAAAARWFRSSHITAVGISFLHSYANPAHEEAARRIFAKVYPECVVSISSEVLREYREYERAVTTLVDAFAKPRVSAYVAAVQQRLVEQLAGGQASACPPFMVMKSNGGIAAAGQVTRHPISTVLSGPAAGALGAAFVAGAAGFARVLTLDGGGTSTDVSVVQDGEPALTTEGSVGRFPVKIPMVDVVTVGTGGGSIAWTSADGGLKVGPRSAGADPGPLCYGKGGAEPTVTDAQLLLGRIPPHLLGGEIPLDVDAAKAGIRALAHAVGLSDEAVAAGVLEIAAWNQANAIRQVTVKRGLDVRQFAMVAFGGSGPLQTCRLLDILGLTTAVVPASPGTLSALGLLTVDVRSDQVQTHVVRHDRLNLDVLRGALEELEARGGVALRDEGFQRSGVLARSVDLRYYGQAFEVRVAAPDRAVDRTFAEVVLAAFHDEHERLYGYCYRDDPDHVVEWVNLRVTGIGPVTPPRLGRVATADTEPSPSATRPVFWDTWVDTPLYDRAGLRAGHHLCGPAVVQEFGSTCPLPPGFTAQVDEIGNLVIKRTST